MKITQTDNFVLVETDVIDLTNFTMNNCEPIRGFFGNYRWLSNFWPATVLVHGISFPTVEHAYVYSKVELSEDELEEMLLGTPGQAKAIGRMKPLRPDFDSVKVEIMLGLLRKKFSDTNADLKQRLIDTGDAELVEVNNWHDTFWGVNLQGVGLNNLGKSLMAVRTEISI